MARLTRLCLILACGLLLATSSNFFSATTIRANGGALRVSRASAGPFEISVFTAPTPLRVGPADVSVAVERGDTGDLEPDARVIVFAGSVAETGQAGAYEASHERATDPAFYAADVPISSPGRWRFEILVLSVDDEGRTSFEVDVPPSAVIDDLQLRVILLASMAALVLALLLVRRRARFSAR